MATCPNGFSRLLAALEREPSLTSISAVPNQRHIFPIMELPAELRIHIYSYALAEGSVKIVQRIDKVASQQAKASFYEKFREDRASKRECPVMSRYLTAEIARPSKRRKRYPSYGTHYTAAILQVNQEMYRETLPLLYGQNQFVFKSFTCLSAFCMDIGPGRRFLTNVELQQLGPYDLRFDMSIMQDASRLRRLRVNQTDHCNWIRPVAYMAVSKIMLPLHRRTSTCTCSTTDVCTCATLAARTRLVNVLKMDVKPSRMRDWDREVECDTDASTLRHAILRTWEERIAEQKVANQARESA